MGVGLVTRHAIPAAISADVLDLLARRVRESGSVHDDELALVVACCRSFAPDLGEPFARFTPPPTMIVGRVIFRLADDADRFSALVGDTFAELARRRRQAGA